MDKLSRLDELLSFISNRLPNVDSNVEPEEIYKELLLLHNNKPIVKTTNMRNLIRLFISKEANKIGITNFHLISRVTDVLIKSAPYQEKLRYADLASEVNEIITSKSALYKKKLKISKVNDDVINIKKLK